MPYELDTYENGEIILEGRQVRRCKKCHVPTHPFEDLSRINRSPRRDFSCTSDGFEIASEKVKIMFEKLSPSPVSYFSVFNNYWAIRPDKYIFCDVSGAGVYAYNQQGNSFCTFCARLTGIFVNKPWEVTLMAGQERVGDYDILRVFPEFGDPLHKMMGIILGDKLFDAIRKTPFTGIQDFYHFNQLD